MLLLVLLLTAGAGVGSWWFTAGRFTTVPSITQVSEAAARQAAQANNLGVATATEYSEDVAAGLVISTDPGGGTRVFRGDTMTLVISLGPERFLMPEVVGTSLDAARSTLEDNHLVVGDVEEFWSEDVAAGVVMSSSEEQGASLKRDTTIDLTVSRGPEPVPIEDFKGRPGSSAKKQLEKAGFVVEVTEENSATIEKGIVISQTPSSGTGKRGDTVKLVESLGPVMVDIPDVKYKSTEEAQKILEAVGLVVEVENVTGFPLPSQFAVGTKPEPGTSVREGSTVVLLVA